MATDNFSSADKAFKDSVSEYQYGSRLQNGFLLGLETHGAKIMKRSVVTIRRLISICLSTNMKLNKLVAACYLVPLFVVFYLNLTIFNRLFKRHVFLLERENAALKLKRGVLEINHNSL